MAGITAVSNNAIALTGSTAGAVNINVSAQAQAAGSVEEPQKLSFSGADVNNKDKAKEASESADSGEPAHIQQLRKHIERLKKQLAEQQKQLQAIINSKMEATAKAAAVSGAQSAVSTTMGALMTATAQLVKALTENGGGGAGSVVSTSA